MKNFLHISMLIGSCATVLTVMRGSAQDCRVLRDTVIDGPDAGSFSDYLYDAAGRIAQVNYYDSGSTASEKYAKLSYDEGGRLAKIEFENRSDSSRIMDIKYLYDDDKVVRVEAAYHEGLQWAVAHNIAYDKGGSIKSITADKASVSGTPMIFDGSISGIEWRGGNPVSFKMAVSNGVLSLVATYDDKKNVQRKLLNREGAAGVLLAAMANNLMQLRVVKSTAIKNNPVTEGTVAMDYGYTYNAMGEVETLIRKPALFEKAQPQTTRIISDCPVKESLPAAATDILNIRISRKSGFITPGKGSFFSGTVKIYDSAGREVKTSTFSVRRSSLDVSALPPGIYSVEMTDGDKISRGVFQKKTVKKK